MRKPCKRAPGRPNGNGYGVKKFQGKQVLAHRLVFFQAYGYWPTICRHDCDNRWCIEITHLLDGTYADNTADMMERGRQFAPNRGKTHCKRGHEFTPENTYWSGPERAWRTCRACKREDAARRWAERVVPTA